MPIVLPRLVVLHRDRFLILASSEREAQQQFALTCIKRLVTAHIDSLDATIDTITINGNVGVVLGTYDEKTTDATGQSSEAKLQYVAEWIYQSNGQWLLNRLSTVILQQ